METNNATQQTSAPHNHNLIIAIVALIVVIIAAVAVVVVVVLGQKDDDNGLMIGYSTEATVFLDQQSLQQAMDAAMRNAAEHNVALLYQNDAYSTDGENFTCYIANSGSNLYDMFLTIFADAELHDQVYMSQLLRPGTGFESIKLDHELEPGVTTVYVAATLVDTAEDGTQVIKSQVVHTMDFHVSE